MATLNDSKMRPIPDAIALCELSADDLEFAKQIDGKVGRLIDLSIGRFIPINAHGVAHVSSSSIRRWCELLHELTDKKVALDSTCIELWLKHRFKPFVNSWQHDDMRHKLVAKAIYYTTGYWEGISLRTKEHF